MSLSKEKQGFHRCSSSGEFRGCSFIEACDGGRILVNGKVARASYAVKEGDLIEIQMGNKPLKAKVLSVSEYATKESASQMYRVEE